MLARLARVFLIVALLAGWQSALQHPIEHVDELGELVHLRGGHSQDGDSTGGLPCDALGALTACVAKTPALAATAPAALEVVFFPADALHPAQAPPFLSQGPPIAPV